MQTKWYTVRVSCPKCNKQANLLEVEHSADGELKFNCYCNTCKQDVWWKVYAASLAHIALVYDIENRLTKETVKPLAKPKELSPSTALQSGDKEFLGGLGIKESK